jgi:hypothetical protein
LGTYVDGIGASQNIDSSGEIVDIAGLDISSLEIDGSLNWEHKKDVPDQLVGKILKARKIFSVKDCEDDRQKYYWEKCQVPYLYVLGELFDDYTDSARTVAGLFRYDLDHRGKNAKDIIGFSVEGATISKQGNTIVRSIARKITCTGLPCNKQAVAEMVPSSGKKPKDNLDNIFKTENYVEIEVVKMNKSEGLWDLLKKESLVKRAKELFRKPMKKDVGAGGLAYGSSSGLSGSGPISPTNMMTQSEPDMARTEKMAKGHGNSQESPYPQAKHKGNLDVSHHKGINKPVHGGPIGESATNPNVIRDIGGSAKQLHGQTLKEMRSMPKPSLPKSEDMSKALKIVPPSTPNGSKIGTTSSGKDVHSHAKVSETGFNAKEHEEAAAWHKKAANANPSMARHHNDKANLHSSAAISMKDREIKRNSRPKSANLHPNASPKTDKLHDPGMSGKVDYKKSETLRPGEESNAKEANQKQQRARRAEEAYPNNSKRHWDKHKVNRSSSNISSQNQQRQSIPNKQVLDPTPAAGAPNNNMLHNNLQAPRQTMHKSLEAGSGLCSPDRLVGGAALVKESLEKDSKDPNWMPKDKKIDHLQRQIDQGTYRPDSKKTAEVMLKHPKRPLKKSAAYKRVEEEYDKWEKREEFETFMKSRMPYMTKGEIRAFGQAMLLNKSMKLEKSLDFHKSLAASFFKKDKE